MRTLFSSLAVPNPDNLRFGVAPKPVSCGFGLQIGGGTVYPELNFTLPTMTIDSSTWGDVVKHYTEIGEMIVKASRRLRSFEARNAFGLFPHWVAG